MPRRDFFVTTKIGDQNLAEADLLPSVEKSLETLGLEQVDLLLIHWPSQGDAVPFESYMTGLREAQERGHARLIGVSNFPIADLERTRALLGDGAIATDQVEIHPFLQSPHLRDYARSRGLVLTAYQPLAKGDAALPMRLVSPNFHFLREVLLQGLGMGIVPDYMVSESMASGALQELDLPAGSLDFLATHKYLLYMPTRFQTRAIRTLIDFVHTRALEDAA